MPECILDPCVEDELWGIWCFIARDNPDAATRVVEAAYETFQSLADAPDLGRIRKFRNPRLKKVRSYRVSGFDNYLVFYRPTPEGIQVLHVYHGARDMKRCLVKSELLLETAIPHSTAAPCKTTSSDVWFP